ncbi:MAG: hypothetical protein NC247_05945 [Ruminococcus flavefaciens]|nr:hypothetical protein [Ruminococcus flavefaciens]MCM1360851.1 hypothetical protein [Clostridiales bacterium]MCM1434925.1 hypothetical protein [Ruminococcus flavefaciens]
MDNQRAIALLIAVAAALLVVLAGRSCMKNIEEQNKEAEKNKPAVYSSPIITETTTAEIIVPSAAETTEPYSGETTAVTTTKSMLDEFWDSEQPNYLDPYGYYDGIQTPSVVEIEIG